MPKLISKSHKLLIILPLNVKVSKSRKQNMTLWIVPKNERDGLFFVRFLEESMTIEFAFEIQWPLVFKHI